VQRLTAQDLMSVWTDERGWSQDIGCLAVLEGGDLLDPDGRFDIDAARHHIGRRLHLLPRSRQILHRPRLGLGWPLWVDAPSIDLGHHVREVRVAPPADRASLLLAVEQARHQPFDRSRPLWGMWFFTGLAENRVWLYIRLHHSIADGVAGVAALTAFVDLEPVPPDPPALAPPPWKPAPSPSSRDLLEDNLRRHLEAIRRAVTGIVHPIRTLRRSRAGWPALREAFGERVPRPSFNASAIGPHRRFALVPGDLTAVKRVARANQAKVNDVLMTVITDGLRALLVARGEPVEGVTLRAFVPVSLHTEGPAEASGNLDGGMFVPLPVGEADAGRRLRWIARRTGELKQTNRPPGGTLFRNRPIQRLATRLAPRQRAMNIYVANVPGPPMPLYFAGAAIRTMFPVVPLLGNVSIGIGALSYAGQFNVTVVADRDLCPDLDVFVEGLERSRDRLMGVVDRAVEHAPLGAGAAGSGSLAG
jgi:WS/DGAT/MGAT family acyltransferase